MVVYKLFSLAGLLVLFQNNSDYKQLSAIGLTYLKYIVLYKEGEYYEKVFTVLYYLFSYFW